MTKDEALKLALEALDWENCNDVDVLDKAQKIAITAIKEALARPAQEPMAKPTPEPTPEELEKIMLEVWQPVQPAQEPYEVRELLIMAAAMAVVMVRNGTYQRASDVADAILDRPSQPAQEPVAMRYDYDGYGYKYIDSGSGSDWQTRIKDAEPVYTIQPAAQPAQEGLLHIDRLDKWLDASLKERAQPAQEPVANQCKGIPRKGCNYLTACDRVCNKCGEIHHHHQMVANFTFPPQRPWVGLTKKDKWEIVQVTERDDRSDVMELTEAKLKDKNTP